MGGTGRSPLRGGGVSAPKVNPRAAAAIALRMIRWVVIEITPNYFQLGIFKFVTWRCSCLLTPPDKIQVLGVLVVKSTDRRGSHHRVID